MSVLDGDYILTDNVWDELVWVWDQTDAPKGCKVEITSKATAHHDRTAKAMGYAEAGVPLYFLVDASAPGGPTVMLYGEPKEGVYRLRRAGKFGERITLPEPFGLEPDTSEFPEK
ncbi:Uma2 family endonuclease [Streptomyces coeruleorubidus]